MSSTVFQCSTLACPKGAQISADLLARHEGLVQWVVRRQYLGDLSFADALAEGRIGLWHALRGYDPGRGAAFSSYAVPAIAHAVWDAVAERRPTAVPSAWIVTGGLCLLERARARLVACRPVGGMLPAAHPRASDEPFDPDEWAHAGQVRAGIRALVEQLPPRLRLVVVAHYGLGEAEPESYGAIGRTLGVTRQRVQQLHVEALLWLAHPAHSLPLRRLLDRASRADCRRALADHYRVARTRRGGGRRGR